MVGEVARNPSSTSRTFGAANGRQPSETAESAAIKEHGGYMGEVAKGLNRIAKSIENANDLKERQQKALGEALKKWGPWLLASVPVIVTAVGGIAPNLAEAISHIVAAAPK